VRCSKACARKHHAVETNPRLVYQRRLTRMNELEIRIQRCQRKVAKEKITCMVWKPKCCLLFYWFID